MTVFYRLAGIVTLCIVFAFGAAACGKKPAPAAPAPPPPAATAPAAPPAPPQPAPPPPDAPAPAALSEEELMARKSLKELNDERPLADVFFELDESSIRDEARPALQKNAEWLKRWSSMRITIEGHADERGSSEYNLGLADRRATAVRSYLVSLGIPADRMAVVSKGKESPFCTESSEACWQQNRRGHFVITGK
jgi:peptidoglycan-associated lipoprotein